MKIRFIKIYVVALVACLAIISCDDMNSIHEPYLNGEQVYAGRLDSVEVFSGYKRVKIVGQTQFLGNAKEATVTWGDQSQVFPISNVTDGIFEMIVEPLAEQSFEFKILTNDEVGNESVKQTVKGRAIGDIFKSSQSARRIVSFDLENGDYIIWADKAESEYVVSTLIRYENNDGGITEVIVLPEDDTTELINWKPEGNLEIISTIISGEKGFDTIDLDAVQKTLPIPPSGINRDWTLAATIQVSNENGGGSGAGEGSPKVIDGDLNSKYLYDYASNSWMQQTLPNEGIVNGYILVSGNDAPDRDPKDWTLEGSNDETNWTTLDTRTDETFAGRNEIKEYAFDSSTPYKYYRMTINANNGSGLFQLSEWRLYETDVPEIDLTEYLLSAITVSKDFPDGPGGAEGSLKVVDGDLNSKFLIFDYPTDFWMQQELLGAAIANQYTLTSGNDAPSRDPKDWILAGSNDAANWVELDDRTGETFSGRNETKAYTFNSATPYKYYRINITANNGDGLFQLSEWRILNVAD